MLLTQKMPLLLILIINLKRSIIIKKKEKKKKVKKMKKKEKAKLIYLKCSNLISITLLKLRVMKFQLIIFLNFK